ncbi:HNH endonuclease [Microvirga rosea]|uniref:HNH endonuclease n=1 Tax=Microvirga rosea TaxID=2715425 RepID=UPI001D0BCD5D|nr:HNH endonuclease [Microvirga rosea]MCB8820921.1 HNH endonuclease [Microvirga rosea]
MPLFNEILQSAGVDPADTLLLRHQWSQPGGPTAFKLWVTAESEFQRWQNLQKKPLFDGRQYLASFVATPDKEALFVGLYRIVGKSVAPDGMRDPISGEDVGGWNFYDTWRDPRLSDYVGDLVIDWGRGFIQWHQRAERQNKRVVRYGVEALENAGAEGDSANKMSEALLEAIEGRRLTCLHEYRERSGSLPARVKARALERHGKLVCECCGFDFEARYGLRGHGFIECHHKKPIATLMDDGEPTKESDLALVCANCHRMIHASKPWLTVEELRRLIRQ